MVVDIYNTDKKYNIIYADPPWIYRDKALALEIEEFVVNMMLWV